MKALALVNDLIDRSKISAAVPEVEFTASAAACAGADLVVVDLGGHAGDVTTVRSVAPKARIVAFGRHDNPEALAQAQEDGADAALPRSRFFRDPGGSVTP